MSLLTRFRSTLGRWFEVNMTILRVVALILVKSQFQIRCFGGPNFWKNTFFWPRRLIFAGNGVFGAKWRNLEWFLEFFILRGTAEDQNCPKKWYSLLYFLGELYIGIFNLESMHIWNNLKLYTIILKHSKIPMKMSYIS